MDIQGSNRLWRGSAPVEHHSHIIFIIIILVKIILVQIQRLYF